MPDKPKPLPPAPDRRPRPPQPWAEDDRNADWLIELQRAHSRRYSMPTDLELLHRPRPRHAAQRDD